MLLRLMRRCVLWPPACAATRAEPATESFWDHAVIRPRVSGRWSPWTKTSTGSLIYTAWSRLLSFELKKTDRLGTIAWGMLLIRLYLTLMM